jgi:hypothetical protein
MALSISSLGDGGLSRSSGRGAGGAPACGTRHRIVAAFLGSGLDFEGFHRMLRLCVGGVRMEAGRTAETGEGARRLKMERLRRLREEDFLW